MDGNVETKQTYAKISKFLRSDLVSLKMLKMNENKDDKKLLFNTDSVNMGLPDERIANKKGISMRYIRRKLQQK